MFSFISTLQRKPERVRKRIAVFVSAAITGVIVVFWLIGLSVQEPALEVASLQKELGPFQALTEGIGLLFSNAAETLQGAVGAFSGNSVEAPVPTGDGTASIRE